MSAEDAQSQGDKPNPEQGKPFPGRFVFEYDKQPINDLADAIKKHTHAQQKEKSNAPSTAERQANEQARANRLSIVSLKLYRKYNIATWVAVGINALIFGATAVVLFYNIRSANAAKEAADAAKAAVEEYKGANKTATDNYNLAKEANKSSSIDNERRFKLDSQSAEQQIKALRGTLAETKNEFRVLNEPYLQALYPKICRLGLHELVGVYYMVVNLKETPIQIISQRDGITITANPPDINQIATRGTDIPGHAKKYIIKETGMVGYYYFPRIETEAFLKKVKDRKVFIYYTGEITYKNLITGTNRVYRYQMKMSPSPIDSTTDTEFIYNKNWDK